MRERSKHACSMMRGAFSSGRFSAACNQTLIWYICLICDLVTINQQMLVSFVRLTALHHAARGFDTCLQHPVMCLSPVRHPSDVKCSFLHVFVTSWPHSHGRKYFCGNSIEWHRKSTLTPMPQLLLGSCTQRGSRRSTHD